MNANQSINQPLRHRLQPNNQFGIMAVVRSQTLRLSYNRGCPDQIARWNTRRVWPVLQFRTLQLPDAR